VRFKFDHKAIHCWLPISNQHRPFFGNLADCQVDSFYSRIVRWEQLPFFTALRTILLSDSNALATAGRVWKFTAGLPTPSDLPDVIGLMCIACGGNEIPVSHAEIALDVFLVLVERFSPRYQAFNQVFLQKRQGELL
jgi:hypothetical protein